MNLKRYLNKQLNSIFQSLLLPVLYYSGIFFMITYPLLMKFHTHFFADQGDGIQGIWNLWWVNKVITQLHQLPWHTSYIHYPHGTSLISHTLAPFNGLIAIPLLKFFSLIEAHNLIVIFSFVSAGVTAFLLAYYLTGAYGASLIGGAVFTFSNYHFAHAEGHLSLVSLEWIPLFVLAWYIFLMKPGVFLAVVSSLLLLLNLLCDHRYFLYCFVTACLMMFWYALRYRKPLFMLRRPHASGLLTFFLLTILFIYPVITSLMRLYMYEHVRGPPAENFSLDMLAPFIPGGHWRFANLTHFYWSRLPGNIHESSVYVGWAVIIMLCFVFFKRKEGPLRNIWLWYSLMVFWGVLSLGPRLHIFGRAVSACITPYAAVRAAAGRIFPALKISENPVRMMVMVMLCASVLSAAGFKLLLEGGRIGRIAAFCFLALLIVEYLPAAIPATQLPSPGYVEILKNVPGKTPVIDQYAGQIKALYYQTIHEKPIAYGYISRVPASVQRKDAALDKRDFRFLVTPTPARPYTTRKIFYSDKSATIYDLAEDQDMRTP